MHRKSWWDPTHSFIPAVIDDEHCMNHWGNLRRAVSRMNLSQNTCIRKQKFSGFGGIKRTTFFRVQNEYVMTKNRTDPNSFYYQQTHKGANYQLKDYWQPGDSLSDSDHELLIPVQIFYQQNRYPPSQNSTAATATAWYILSWIAMLSAPFPHW